MSLKKVTIPGSVTTFGSNLFEASAIEEIIVEESCEEVVNILSGNANILKK